MTTTPERTHPMTAPVSPTLYGPDGRAITPQPLRDDWAPVRTEGTATVWERPRLVPNDDDTTTRSTQLLATAQAEADQLLADAREEADQARTETRSLNARTIANAEAEARRIREAATQAAEQKTEKAARIDKWMARAVIAGAVGLTASGEFMLARLAHFPWQVAWLLPFVIDVYVIQAFRRHRDIAQAILLTVAANVVYHLAAAGMLGVTVSDNGDKNAEWWLIALVASVASVILWRMHVITAPPKPAKEKRRRRAADVAVADIEPMPAEARGTATATTETPARATGGSDTRPSPVGSGSGSDGSSSVAAVGSAATANPTQAGGSDGPKSGSANGSGGTAKPRRSGSATGPRGGRGSTSGGSDNDKQVLALVALMKRRGSANSVTLADAQKTIGGNVSERTAARRLKAARTHYATLPS